MSRFYYPTTIWKGNNKYKEDTPFVPDLRLVNDTTAILSTDSGEFRKGLYVRPNDKWEFALPMIPISEGVIVGYELWVYYNITTPVTDLPVNSRLFRNGTEVDASLPIQGVGIWVAMVPTNPGTVATVNGVGPDTTGNVELKSVLEISVSVPTSPDPGSLLLYQRLPNCTFKSLVGSVGGSSSTSLQFSVLLDSTNVGTIDVNGSTVIDNTTLNTVNDGQVLTISTPDPMDTGVQELCFVLDFIRN